MSESFDDLPCAYVSFCDDGRIGYCNETLSSWVGWSKDELIGKSIENIFTLATRIFYNTHFFPLIKLHGRANEVFFSLKGKDNSDIAVLANAKRVKNANDHVIRCVFVQVSERKKYEQELLNAKRAAEQALTENKHLVELTRSLEEQAIILDQQYHTQVSVHQHLLQFNKIISHDFQEPIRKIRIFAELISKNVSEQDMPSISLCAKIDSAAEKLKTLTNGLQQYILVDTEKHYSAVDLNHAAISAKDRVINERAFADFGFKTESLPVIHGYQSQLELLFYHLVDNAVQFRHPDRRLQIEIESLVLHENVFRMLKEKYKYTEHVRIRFSDNGIGFDSQYADYVFELLSKMNGSSKGLGLGLSLAKRIAENHAGRISVTATSEKGTTFEILLPVHVKG